MLVATRNPLNIGAAARAMSNFGFSRLRVVNPYELAFREARSAVGASALLRRAQEYDDGPCVVVAEVVKELEDTCNLNEADIIVTGGRDVDVAVDEIRIEATGR